MKPILPLIFVIFGFLAGYFLGRQNPSSSDASVPAVAVETEKDNCQDFEKFKAQLSGISAEEIRAYLKTQDAEQKLKKADEILGKMVQLLVAQVGFQINKDELQQFGKIPDVGARADNQPPATVPAAATVEPAPEPPGENRVHASQLTARINAVENEQQARSVLRSMGTNFTDRINQSGDPTADEVQNLNGDFEGTAVFDKDRRTQRLILHFQGQIIQKKLQGSWSMQSLADGGKQVGSSSGRGNLARDFSGNDNEIFIEFGSQYFQLVYVPSLDQWMGNILVKNRTQYNKVGFASLRRR